MYVPANIRLNMKKSLLGCLLLALLFPAAAAAAPFTFFGTGVNSEDPENPTGLAALAVFENIGGSLVITLSNLSTADVTKTSSVLTALFFDLVGSPTLTPLSALVGPSSSLLQGSTVLGGAETNVGDFWAYESTNDISGDEVFPGGPRGTDYGISAAGLDNLFATGDFDGAGGQTVNGVNYGILPSADNPTTGSGAGQRNVTNLPLINNSAIFTLSGLALAFDPSVSIFNVNFQYGSSLGEPNIIPEPGTLWLFGSGLALLAHQRLRRRR